METTNASTKHLPPPPADELLRPGQAAKLIGVHLATLYRWMDDGTLPYWTVGKRQRRLHRPDVLAMVQPRRAEPRCGPKRASSWERQETARQTAEVLDRWHGKK